MTNTQFQAATSRTYPTKNKPAMLKHAVLGLTSEAGEVSGIMQKVYQGHGSPLTDPSVKDHMIKELGDCLWMVAEACSALDVTIADVMDLNIRKLQDRYPDGFDPFLSLHRKPGDI